MNGERKKMYLYLFGAAQDHKHGKKNVPIEEANAYWNMLLKDKCNYLPLWCAFMAKRLESGKQLVVTKDTWDMFWELLDSNKGNLQATEDDGCWPTIIEDFCREQGVFK